MGDIPAGPAGFTRFLMKSKFGAGRDFAVLDPDTEAQLFFVDGKLGPRPKAEVQAGDGSVIYSVKGRCSASRRRCRSPTPRAPRWPRSRPRSSPWSRTR